MNQSLERIIPDALLENESTGSDTLALHMQRYDFAAQHLVPGHVLDLACGVGYGTFLLSHQTQVVSVTGVDLDSAAIDYARTRYAHPKSKFIHMDALKFKPEVLFDTIVSLETIEHVPDPLLFVKHLRTLMRPGGRLIASVPTTPSVDANPHHLTDFTPDSFKNLVTASGFATFKEFQQIQKFSLMKIILRREARAERMRKNMLSYYLHRPRALWARLSSTMRYGFSNRYLTAVFEAK